MTTTMTPSYVFGQVSTEDELKQHLEKDPFQTEGALAMNVRSILSDELSGLFNFSPVFQRPKVWSNKKKWEWVFSVIMNTHNTDQILCNSFINGDGMQVRELINGQQRITTLKDFTMDKFKLPPSFSIKPFAGKKYSELPEWVRFRIQQARLNIVTYRNLTPQQLAVIFIGAQQGQSLSQMNLRNALPLEKPRLILSTLQGHHIFSHIKKTEETKKSHDRKELLLRGYYLIEKRGNYNLTGASLTGFYIRELGDVSQITTSRLKQILDFIYKSLKPKKYDRLTKLHYGELTNLICLVDHLELNYSLTFNQDSSIEEFGRVFNDFLNYLNDAKQKGKLDKEVCRRFVKKFFSADQKIFRDYMYEFSNFVLLDKKRFFDDVQKDKIFEVCGGRCCSCNVLLDRTEGQYHHIKSHKDGGKTEVSNGQLLCVDCHKHVTKYGELPDIEDEFIELIDKVEGVNPIFKEATSI